MDIMARIVKKPHVRRQEIVNAAKLLFQSKGFAATSMEDVMKQLKIAKGTIYHYFKSKDELLEAVVEQIVLEEVEEKRKLLETTTGSAIERLHALIGRASLASQNEEILDQLHKPGNAAMHMGLLAATLAKEAEVYALIIRQGVDEGIFQTDTPLECAEFILAGIQFLTDTGVYPWTEEQLMRRVMAFPALVEATLKAPPGSFQFLIQLVGNPQ